jgi:hypothetical protein
MGSCGWTIAAVISLLPTIRKQSRNDRVLAAGFYQIEIDLVSLLMFLWSKLEADRGIDQRIVNGVVGRDLFHFGLRPEVISVRIYPPRGTVKKKEQDLREILRRLRLFFYARTFTEIFDRVCDLIIIDFV